MNLTKRKESESGAVMVEFALVSMTLILLLVGIIEFGLIFNTQLVLQNAAREGARYAAIPSQGINDSMIKDYIMSTAQTLQEEDLQITITPSIRQRGQPLIVNLNYTFEVPVTFGILPASYNLTASTVMMRE